MATDLLFQNLAPVESSQANLLSLFLAGRSPQTLRAYAEDIQQFATFIGIASSDLAIRQLLGSGQSGASVQAISFRAHLIERGLSPASVNRRLAALRSVVKLARMLGLVNWSLDIPNVRSETYRDTRGPGAESVRKLLGSRVDKEDKTALRDRAILRLLYDLGLRRGEVANLDLVDVDTVRATVSVLGKGRGEKTLLTLPPTTLAALNAWLAVRGDEPGPFFHNFDRAPKGQGDSRRLTGSGIYRIVRGRAESLGFKAAPHGLRHTAITEACKAAQAAGIALEEVLDFSRHRDVKVLMIYRDRERNVQGRLSALVAETAVSEQETPAPDAN